MNQLNGTKAVIWDWNGTLLDDLEVSIAAMNRMLDKRNYPKLSQSRYKEIFTFPVREYYLRAGVNFGEHEWDEVAMEFIDNYRDEVAKSQIHAGVLDLLNYLSRKNYRQFVLSAMQQEFLTETIGARLPYGLFEKVMGLNDFYAHTKVENAKLLVKEIGLPKNEIVMIGDTIHDFEVAEAVGIACILFAGGHQSSKRLQQTGVPVIETLDQLRELL